MRRLTFPRVILASSFVVFLVTWSNATRAAEQNVQLTQLDDKVRVEIGGQLFTEYCFKNVPRPFCYPLLGPGSAPMSRNWPMQEAENEERDHKHHRSLWYAHGAMNGHDFWAEEKAFGKQLHDRFLEVKSGPEGVIRARNNWVAQDGKVICTDERTLRFRGLDSGEKTLDFEITIYAAPDKELVMGDTKEGTMAVRLAETMRLKGKVGKGHIVNSRGDRDDKTWGKRAEWCDYYGPVQDNIVGIAMFDHPSNPRHPTWWHVRDYGLFAANPFGQHDFEKLQDKNAGDFKIPAGKSATWKYRFVLHKGDNVQAKIGEQYSGWAKGSR